MKRATDIEFKGDVVSFGLRLSRLAKGYLFTLEEVVKVARQQYPGTDKAKFDQFVRDVYEDGYFFNESRTALEFVSRCMAMWADR